MSAMEVKYASVQRFMVVLGYKITRIFVAITRFPILAVLFNLKSSKYRKNDQRISDAE